MSGSEKTWEQAVLWLRDQPDQHALVRDCFFDDPLLDAAKRYRASSEWHAIRKLIPQTPGVALDLGAGRGIAAFALAADGWTTTAVEPDPSATVGANAIRQLAVDSGLAINVAENVGEGLPFSDASFDLVHCRAVLHHAKDLAQLCREVHRVLKPHGIFIATREHVLSHSSDLQTFLDSHPLHRLYGGEKAYTLAEYLSALRTAGFRMGRVLNPFESDVNLFPDTVDAFKRRLAKRTHLPAALVPQTLLRVLGSLSSQPGRHYSFVAYKNIE